MFEKLFHFVSSFSAAMWLDESIVCNRLTKEIR